jgi:hypothetical protein
MLTLRHAFLTFAASLVTAGLTAQTYIGNLDSSSSNSTFTTSTDGFQTLANFGWANVAGSGGAVYGQTGGTSNDALVGVDDFDNYEVEYNTGTAILPNSIYSLSLNMGFLSGGTAGTASYDISLGTKNGGTFTALTADNPALEIGTINRTSGPTNGLSFGTNATNSIPVTVTFTTGASVSGDPLYVRWAQTASSNTAGSDYFGFDGLF